MVGVYGYALEHERPNIAETAIEPQKLCMNTGYIATDAPLITRQTAYAMFTLILGKSPSQPSANWNKEIVS